MISLLASLAMGILPCIFSSFLRKEWGIISEILFGGDLICQIKDNCLEGRCNKIEEKAFYRRCSDRVVCYILA